jgi:hypothetical protein
MCTQGPWLKRLLAPLANRYTRMPGESVAFPVKSLNFEEALLRDSLRQNVVRLASGIGERHRGRYDALEAARDFCVSEFQSANCEPVLHPYQIGRQQMTNVSTLLPGTVGKQTWVVGAHYDSRPGTPGANDNGSGSAAVIELARRMRKLRLRDNIWFNLFTEEETRCFWRMGSFQQARLGRKVRMRIAGMWSLETIGCYSNEPGSQHYPKPFNLFYPDTGNFLAFVGSSLFRGFVHASIEAFRASCRFPSEGVAAPIVFPDIWRSDHLGFALHGFRSLMITDTANFRYWPYHTKHDTADRLDYDSLARVVMGLEFALARLAGAH